MSVREAIRQYYGDCWWVNVERIEAELVEDLARAEADETGDSAGDR